MLYRYFTDTLQIFYRYVTAGAALGGPVRPALERPRVVLGGFWGGPGALGRPWADPLVYFQPLCFLVQRCPSNIYSKPWWRTVGQRKPSDL